MREVESGLIESIYLIKRLYDNGKAENLLKYYGCYELDFDFFYEMAYEAVSDIFAVTRCYYNEEEEFETWVFMDPMLDGFCRLCREYELARGVSEEKNPFRKELEQIIHSGFSFNSYSYNYGWKLSPNDRGRSRILLFTSPEFYCHSDVPCGLLEIQEGLEYCSRRLREELGKQNSLVPLPLPSTEREAA